MHIAAATANVSPNRRRRSARPGVREGNSFARSGVSYSFATSVRSASQSSRLPGLAALRKVRALCQRSADNPVLAGLRRELVAELFQRLDREQRPHRIDFAGFALGAVNANLSALAPRAVFFLLLGEERFQKRTGTAFSASSRTVPLLCDRIMNAEVRWKPPVFSSLFLSVAQKLKDHAVRSSSFAASTANPRALPSVSAQMPNGT